MWRRTTSISRSGRRWARQRRRFPTAACGGTTRRRRCSSPNGRPFWQRPARPTLLWPTGGAGPSAWAASRAAGISLPHSWGTPDCRLQPRSPSSRASASDVTTKNGRPVWGPWPSVWAIQRSDMNLAIDHTTELRHALERSGEPGATELLEALQALLGGAEADGPTIALTQLKRRVYRVDFGPGPGPRSLILKRSEPMIALLNRLVAERWLPAIGLGDRCAPLDR